jgi:hypothetical protein
VSALVRLIVVPFEYAAKIKDGLTMNMLGWWWTVDPQRGLVFSVSGTERRPRYHPQGNTNPLVTRKLFTQLYPPSAYPTLGTQLVPLATFHADHEGAFLLPKDLERMDL